MENRGFKTSINANTYIVHNTKNEAVESKKEGNVRYVDYQTVFVDLRGKLGTYAKNIFTNGQTKNNLVIQLQTQLNIVLKKYQYEPATAENCEALWKEIGQIVKANGVVTPENLASDIKLREIYNAVDKIGYAIAYLSNRKGWKGDRPIVGVVDFTDEEKLKVIKLKILYDYSTGELTEEIANQCGIVWATDEKLLEMANGWIPTASGKQVLPFE